jgi:hypothetical protein
VKKAKASPTAQPISSKIFDLSKKTSFFLKTIVDVKKAKAWQAIDEIGEGF